MLNMLEKYLNDKGIFENTLPDIVEDIVSAIPTNTIPYRMKLAFALSEIINFTSQFRINIKHWNGSSIPINAITFCIAKSGAAKDSSLKAVRKCFKDGYNIINQYREDKAVNTAINKAIELNLDAPTNWNQYKQFYKQPNPLFVAISTVEGFIQHLNELDESGIGSGYMFSGEVGAELSNNINLIENIKTIAELYDEGSKEVKVLKDKEAQTKEIKNMPVSAMFIGSQDNLLYDEAIKKKFKTEFTTKLARRSQFIFAYEDLESDTFNSVEELIHNNIAFVDNTVSKRDNVNEYVKELTEFMLDNPIEHIKVSNKVRELFAVYHRYNEELAKTVDAQLPITKLTRTHLQWKALKLSGALALFRGSDIIEEEDYKASIYFLELINTDISLFEKELVKEPYEIFAKFCKEYAIKGSLFVTLHTLRKLGFISSKTNPLLRMKELVQLVSSYDTEGVYKYTDDGIEYTALDKSNNILISYVECTGTKEQRGNQCSTGFICEEIEFSDLEEMLKGDYAYSPFRFLQGKRGKDNIDSSCKWIVLDVDTSLFTDEEVHNLLYDINHYVVRTSNKDNPYKFRILLELDSSVDIPNDDWKLFIKSISDEIGIECDMLPKSQIFYSYSNRNILSVTDQQPIAVKPHLTAVLNKQAKKQNNKNISSKEKAQLLNDSLNTFAPAYYAKAGEGSRKLVWAAKYAKDLGATKEQIIELIYDINNYWIAPMPEDRLVNTIINPIKKWNF